MAQSADTIFCDTAQIFQYQISQQHHFLVRWWGRYLHSTWYLLVHLLLTLPCFLEDLPREVSLHGSSLSLCGFLKHVWCLVTPLWLSSLALSPRARLLERWTCNASLQNIACWAFTMICWYNTQMGTGRLWFGVFYIFLSFCCLFVLFLRKYMDRIRGGSRGRVLGVRTPPPFLRWPAVF